MLCAIPGSSVKNALLCKPVFMEFSNKFSVTQPVCQLQFTRYKPYYQNLFCRD